MREKYHFKFGDPVPVKRNSIYEYGDVSYLSAL